MKQRLSKAQIRSKAKTELDWDDCENKITKWNNLPKAQAKTGSFSCHWVQQEILSQIYSARLNRVTSNLQSCIYVNAMINILTINMLSYIFLKFQGWEVTKLFNMISWVLNYELDTHTMAYSQIGTIQSSVWSVYLYHIWPELWHDYGAK